MRTISRRALIAAAAAAPTVTHPARAQADYPARPVRVIVPFPPGQATDIFARVIADELSKRWPQRVVVENRAGGAGAIGMEAAARAAPDGYTLAMGGFGPMSAAPAMVPSLPYDPVRDFAPIVSVGTIPLLWVVHTSLPARDIREFVALARERALDYGSGGPGSTQHLAGEVFRHRLGLKLNHVAYRGSAPAMTDLVAGVIPAMVDSVASALPNIRAGRVRALAVTAPARVPWLPEVPTVAESFIPGFDVQGWIGLVAPASVPAPVVQRVNADTNAALREPAVLARFEDLAGIPTGGTVEEFARFIRDQVARWREVVREANIRIDG